MQQRPQPGRKRRKFNTKRRYLKGVARFVGKHKTTRKRAARKDRHTIKKEARP